MIATDRTATVNCFSYLASVSTLHVASFPPINYGVDVDRADTFLAGDGPLVAGFLRALGHPTVLYSNEVGRDVPGREVRSRLASWGVPLAPGPPSVGATRVNTVVVDQAGNRTWFSGLRGIADDLTGIDISRLTTAPVVYLDCYEVLGEAPRSILDAALDSNCEIILNLGGSPVPQWLGQATRRRPVTVLQTNASDAAGAARMLDSLCEAKLAEMVVVTAGHDGALARTADGQALAATATAVNVLQVVGAGAAFSAALIHARQDGADPGQAMRFACAAGSLWCSRTHDGPLPRADEISAFAGCR